MTYDDLKRAADAMQSADNLMSHLRQIAQAIVRPEPRANMIAFVGPAAPSHAYEAIWRTWRDRADVLDALGVTGYPEPPTLAEVLKVAGGGQ